MQKQNKNKQLKKKSLFLMALATIIIGGLYFAVGYYKYHKMPKGLDMLEMAKQFGQERENHYNLLEKKCAGGSCCLSSLKFMKENNYKEADKDGKCPKGFKGDMMLCTTSYRWCVPMEKTEWRNCEQDSDCVETQADCCSCGSGGKQIGINKKYLESWGNTLAKKCQDIDCIALFNCKKGNVVCENNKCEFKEETNSDTFDRQTYQN